MDKTLKVLIIAMASSLLIVPIGLIASGTAFGEWGPDELKEAVGYVPGGLSTFQDSGARLRWYDFPGTMTLSNAHGILRLCNCGAFLSARGGIPDWESHD